MGAPINRTAKTNLDGNLVPYTAASSGKLKASDDVIYDYVDGLNQAQDAHAQAATLAHPDGSVKTAKIADGAVTEPKYATGSVSSRAIANGAVGPSQLQTGLSSTVDVNAQFAKRGIDVTSAPYNAKGDGATDDTTAIQAAIDAAYDSGNGGIVFIPKGNYIVSSTLTLRSNVRITGAGASSILKSNFAVTGTYMLQSSSQLTRSVIDNIAIQGDALQIVGGIHVDSAQRGNAIHDVWFLYVATPIYLGDSVTALYSVSNVYAVFFSSSVDTSFLDQAIGIQILGNTVMLDSVEIVGNFGCGILLNGATVVGMAHINVSGSTGYSMRKGISIINSSSQVSVDTAWIEQINSNVTPTQLNNSIEIIGSTKISFNNMQISNGSVFADNSTVTWKGSKFYTADTGIRFKNGAIVYTDADSYGTQAFQNDITYMNGKMFVDYPNDAEVNIINNPIIVNGIVEPVTAVGTGATIASNSSDYFTGDRSMEATCTADFGGMRIDLRNIVKNGETYTVIARVKKGTNVGTLYITTLSGASVLATYPSCSQNSVETGYYLISLVISVTDATNCYVRVIGTKSNPASNYTFLVDSCFCYRGFHDLSTKDCFISKSAQVQSRPIYSTIKPFGGSWNQHDYVYNQSPTVLGTAGSQYILKGWMRITTGSGNVLNTDWFEDRALTGT